MFRDTTFDRDDAFAASAELVMDEDAFRAFYERTARGVWAFLTRVTGDRQLADDLLQEAYYRFLRASASHESEEHRRNSLYRIAANLAHDARRKRRTTPPLGEDGAEVERAAGADARVNTERNADLARAMSQLKPRERTMLWLAYGEGASHREIAEVMGVSPSSMKIILFRARKRLAALLGARNA